MMRLIQQRPSPHSLLVRSCFQKDSMRPVPVTGGILFSEEVFSARAGGGASQLELSRSVLTLVRITHFLHLQINCPRAAFSPQVV